jgi:hypothetical protein
MGGKYPDLSKAKTIEPERPHVAWMR